MSGKSSRKIEESSSESDSESTPPLPHTPAVHPKAGAANEESVRKAEGKRTNHNDYVIRVSRKRQLVNSETSMAKKRKTSETGNESRPASYSYTVRMLGSRGEASENKERIKTAERNTANQRNDVVQTSEKNENPAEEYEEAILETCSDFVPKHLCSSCLKVLQSVERKLIYTDEDISLEFAEPTSTQAASHGSTLPNVNKLFQINIKKAQTCYRENNYTAALEYFSRALELCSRGISVENPLVARADDTSSIASFIETKLAVCYLKLKRPSDALTHAHRSISKNPACFQNHMRQAAAFRALGRYSEAARSAMVADFIYWMRGGSEKRTSKYIRYYWQSMIAEAYGTQSSFAAMYTPFEAEEDDDSIINKIPPIFAVNNPEYLQHYYIDPQGFHILPKSTKLLTGYPKPYFLTLGFRSKTLGKLVEKWTTRKLSILSERNAAFNTLEDKEAEQYWETIGQKVMSAMDFRRTTKLIDRCPCSRVIEKLQQAKLFGRMKNLEKQDQLLEQVLAEIATLPYLQDLNEEENKLLELLMADAMDTLGGRIDNQRVWNEISKIGLLEDCLYEAEDYYIKNEKLDEARRERRTNSPGNMPQGRSQRASESRAHDTAGIAPELLSLIRPCSVALERLDFPPYT